MGIYTSGDIFQAKADKLLAEIEGVKILSMIYWSLEKIDLLEEGLEKKWFVIGGYESALLEDLVAS